MNQISTTQKATLLGVALPSGSNVYIALLTTLPTGYDGTGLVECSAAWYARKPNSTWTNSTTDGTVTRKNVGAITFDAATEVTTGICGWAIYDALSGGNLIAAGPILDVSSSPAYLSVAVGDIIEFQVQQLQVPL